MLKAKTSIIIPENTRRKVKILSAVRGISFNTVIAQAIEAYIEKEWNAKEVVKKATKR